MAATNRWAWATLAIALVFTGVQVRAVSDADKCEAAKNTAAGKYGFCRQKALAKAIKAGTPVDYSKCDAKFTGKWAAAETGGGGMCPTVGDRAAMQGCITAHTNAVMTALNSPGPCVPISGLPETGQTQCDQGAGTLGTCPGSPAGQDGALQSGTERTGSFVDNDDGTVTDSATGLMWEKLSDDGTIHDRDNLYTWYEAFTEKIAALNGSGGFAGFTDWRMPTVTELQSIVNYGDTGPSAYSEFSTSCAASCTVTTCSCTQSFYYWSSTTYQLTPADAWLVNFNVGFVDVGSKAVDGHVRAVRGGS